MDTAHTIRWLRVLESNQRIRESKSPAFTAWLTRNIMPVGIQVIIEPLQAESVVPCSWHWRIPNSRKSVL